MQKRNQFAFLHSKILKLFGDIKISNADLPKLCLKGIGTWKKEQREIKTVTNEWQTLNKFAEDCNKWWERDRWQQQIIFASHIFQKALKTFQCKNLTFMPFPNLSSTAIGKHYNINNLWNNDNVSFHTKHKYFLSENLRQIPFLIQWGKG